MGEKMYQLGLMEIQMGDMDRGIAVQISATCTDDRTQQLHSSFKFPIPFKQLSLHSASSFSDFILYTQCGDYLFVLFQAAFLTVI